ncbi:hypothetical protein MAPG_06755 [Magnaporthiopsis poae ATCC 64411]|uniref:Uncharacterized protein n=1 Tax=Magnaporthiopsis poae (strain ATCC 64411 / 73-15) TaxID=644358 RepID=A0A0C4E2W3_MAGP6|nr:hypothetical protein MAPG_06755 [Magnaporthiopsis poae ATCC 64411]
MASLGARVVLVQPASPQNSKASPSVLESCPSPRPKASIPSRRPLASSHLLSSNARAKPLPVRGATEYQQPGSRFPQAFFFFFFFFFCFLFLSPAGADFSSHTPLAKPWVAPHRHRRPLIAIMGGDLTSSGRGGAGNIVEKAKSPAIEPKDLETPTLKTSVVTTGRGGTGNMAKNTDPAETRALQDVEPVSLPESTGATHIGRGGDGNVIKPKAERPEDGGGKELARAKSAGDAAAAQDSADTKKDKESLATKGKHWLMGKK